MCLYLCRSLLFLNHLNAQEEPVDIWNLKKKAKENSTITQTENDDAEEISINVGVSNLNNSSDIIDSDLLLKVIDVSSPEHSNHLISIDNVLKYLNINE